MAYLREQKIRHRDIKPGNLLEDYDGNWKWGDFGIALKAGERGFIIEGTLLFLAPEIIQHSAYSDQSELWAYGMTLIQLITTEKSFKDNIIPLYDSLKMNMEPNRIPAVEEDFMESFLDGLHKDLESLPHDNPSLGAAPIIDQSSRRDRTLNTNTTPNWKAETYHFALELLQDSPDKRPSLEAIIYSQQQALKTLSKAQVQTLHSDDESTGSEDGSLRESVDDSDSNAQPKRQRTCQCCLIQ